MAEKIYPYEKCKHFRCQLPQLIALYNQADAWEEAAVANAKASTDPTEAKAYYDQAKKLHNDTRNNKRMIEDFTKIPKPENCQSCSLFPAGLGRDSHLGSVIF